MIPAKVLIVEDERVVALHLKQQLLRLGYQVPAIATSGDQALKQIGDHQPDAILIDIHLEGDVDGIETSARIPVELQIPVIYLTAYSEEPTLERARQTKPYGYLVKPFSEQELHATVQMALERTMPTQTVVELTGWWPSRRADRRRGARLATDGLELDLRQNLFSH